MRQYPYWGQFAIFRHIEDFRILERGLKICVVIKIPMIGVSSTEKKFSMRVCKRLTVLQTEFYKKKKQETPVFSHIVPSIASCFPFFTTRKRIIGALIVQTTIVNFSYFEISIGMCTPTHILFNRRLPLFF